MHFRPGTPADIPQLLPKVTALYALHTEWDAAKFAPRAGFEAGYGRWLASQAENAEGVFLVASGGDAEDGPLVGYLVGTVEHEIPVYLLKQYGFIHDLWVDEDFRHEGVARQLVMLAVERFKAMGLTQVRCETATANDAARELFGKCGFRPATTMMLGEF